MAVHDVATIIILSLLRYKTWPSQQNRVSMAIRTVKSSTSLCWHEKIYPPKNQTVRNGSTTTETKK